MSGLKVVCSICLEIFRAEDSLCVTSCGHMHHSACLQEWKDRSEICPQCRSLQPSSQRVYLAFDEDGGKSKADEDMQAKLASSIDKIHELETQLQLGDCNLLGMQKQFCEERKTRQQLEQQIADMKDSYSDFLHMQSEYVKADEHLRRLLANEALLQAAVKTERQTLEKQAKSLADIEAKYLNMQTQCRNAEGLANVLRQENESLRKENALKTKELSSLIPSQALAAAEIDKLQQKLQQMAGERQREISLSADLKLENIRLQRNIQLLNMDAMMGAVARNQLPSTAKEKDNNTPKQTNGHHANNSQKHFDLAGVVIAHMPVADSSDALEELVIKLGALMGIYLTKNDLGRIDKKMGQNNTFDLFFELKQKSHFAAVIHKRSELSKIPKYAKVKVRENLDKETLALYLYAGRKLRSKGFEHVHFRCGEVTVKRHRNDAEGIIIKSREQVDQLSVQEAELTRKMAEATTCDELNSKRKEKEDRLDAFELMKKMTVATTSDEINSKKKEKEDRLDAFELMKKMTVATTSDEINSKEKEKEDRLDAFELMKKMTVATTSDEMNSKKTEDEASIDDFFYAI